MFSTYVDDLLDLISDTIFPDLTVDEMLKISMLDDLEKPNRRLVAMASSVSQFSELQVWTPCTFCEHQGSLSPHQRATVIVPPRKPQHQRTKI